MTDSTRATALAFVGALANGAWTDAAALVSARVEAGAMSAEVLQGMWTGIVAQLGTLASVAPTGETDDGAYRQVDLAARFARSAVTLRVVLASDDRVAGLWVRPPAPPAYEPPPYVDASRFTERELVVGTAPSLPATFTQATADGPTPVVVLVHGSGPNDRDERIGAARPFRDLAWGLASRGIAVLRYDKRTFAHPRALAGVAVTLDIETIDDAVAAIGVARAQPGVDPQRVVLLGHSLGATFAAEIAARAGDVSGLVLLAPAGRPIATVVAEQLEHLAERTRAAGGDTAELDALRPQIAALAERSLDRETVVLGAPAWYWYDLDDRRPVERTRASRMPMFLAFGGADHQVTADDARSWHAALDGRADVVIRRYAGLSHLFAPHDPDAPAPTGHVDVRLIEDVAAWIGRGEAPPYR